MSRPSDYERGVKLAEEALDQVVQGILSAMFPHQLSQDEADEWGGIAIAIAEARLEIDSCALAIGGSHG